MLRKLILVSGVASLFAGMFGSVSYAEPTVFVPGKPTPAARKAAASTARTAPPARRPPPPLPPEKRSEIVAATRTASAGAVLTGITRTPFTVDLAQLSNASTGGGAQASVWWPRDIWSDWVDFNPWQAKQPDDPALFVTLDKSLPGGWFVDCEVDTAPRSEA
jgi:hypothetical protein